MPAFDLTDPLVLQLRIARPVAPDALRSRVAALGAPKPARVWPVRRMALVLAPAVVVAGVGAALIHGIVNSGSTSAARHQVVTPTVAYEQSLKAPLATPHGLSTQGATPYSPATPRSSDQAFGKAIAPSSTRLQKYQASLTVRVKSLDALAPQTQKAMRTARALGGYVVSAHYGAQKQGYSSLVFRIPIGNVQKAIARFSGLGVLVAQQIDVQDLQARYDSLTKSGNRLQLAIAKVNDKLANPNLTNAQRVALQQERTNLAAALSSLTSQKGSTVRQAQLATVSISLTTEKAIVPVQHHNSGPIGRAFDDAGSILAKEVSWGLYALIVIGPLALLAALAFALTRYGRRHADRRLLESS
jgi:hypothetical protein